MENLDAYSFRNMILQILRTVKEKDLPSHKVQNINLIIVTNAIEIEIYCAHFIRLHNQTVSEITLRRN